MALQQMLHPLRDAVTASANVRSVYGEPITAAGKTIIPVARIGYGFGAGSGPRAGEEGAGGGGGAGVMPVGALEITQGSTRYIPFGQGRKLAVAFVAGLFLGKLLARR